MEMLGVPLKKIDGFPIVGIGTYLYRMIRDGHGYPKLPDVVLLPTFLLYNSFAIAVTEYVINHTR